MLAGKRVILGISGSIAAYKAAILIRLLVKAGADVRVVMTEAAQDFITPLTLATLSKNPVLSTFTAHRQEGLWNNHVDLGLWADVMVVAPASAHTLAKMAHGLCEDLLTAVYLSARCPVFVTPAMDLDMYQHNSTQENLQKLRKVGNFIIDAEEGELASGLVGVGRMAEPEHILHVLKTFFQHRQVLAGKKMMITAGPTQEAIDPVRFITNASSGKMGYALAEAAAEMGGQVKLVSGPTALTLEHPAVSIERVTSTQDMLSVCSMYFSQMDIVIFAAAVADYTPQVKYKEKVKKSAATMVINLEKTPDIAKTLGAQKGHDQFLVGFALETNDELENARKKLTAKHFDMIILNSLNDQGAGFGYDTNQVNILFRHSSEVRIIPLKSKKEVATDILQAILEHLHV